MATETPGEPAKPLALTNLGYIAYLHTTATPPTFWSDLAREIIQIQEWDGDWEHLIEERLKGMEMLRDCINEHGSDWLKLKVAGQWRKVSDV
jgi:hypothetical protein